MRSKYDSDDEDSNDVDVDDSAEDLDPAMQRLLRVRERAMELCGGLDVWDELGEEEVEHFLAAARAELDGRS
jgi:hypothetical protein